MLRDCEGADSVSDDSGRIEGDDGRLPAGRLADLRAAGRDFGVADRGLDDVDLGRLGVAALRAVERVPAPLVLMFASLVRADLPAGFAARDEELRVDELRDDVPRVEVPRDDEARDDGRDDDVRDDGRVDVARRVVGDLRAVVVRPVVRPAEVAVAGLAEDIVLAAAVSAFAAVIMAFVAVFIDFMAEDIVCADAVALVAAAVILVAADVTLVAAEDTPLAAVAGEAELRLVRVAALVLRVAVEREAVGRDAVDRDAVLPVDREAVLRVVVLAAVPVARFAAVLRAVLGLAPDVLELELDGRLAVPLDALRLTDLLRAVLAELRRAAALVVD